MIKKWLCANHTDNMYHSYFVEQSEPMIDDKTLLFWC